MEKRNNEINNEALDDFSTKSVESDGSVARGDLSGADKPSAGGAPADSGRGKRKWVKRIMIAFLTPASVIVFLLFLDFILHAMGVFGPPSSTDGLIYTEVDGGYAVSGLARSYDDVEEIFLNISDSHNGLPVVAVADGAFENCDRLKMVDLPENATSIGKNAFYGCRALVQVDLGDSVASIGEDAFRDCSALTAISIPSAVTAIGNDAFVGCEQLSVVSITDVRSWCGIEFSNQFANPLCNGAKLRYVNKDNIGRILSYIEIPEDVTRIGSYAFYGVNGLHEVVIHGGVTEMGREVFYSNDRLTIHAHAYERPEGWDTAWNVYGYYVSWGSGADGGEEEEEEYSGPLTFTLSEDGSCYSVTGCAESAEYVEIPKEYLGLPVTEIGEGAFSGLTELREIYVPDSVTRVGRAAFAFCSALYRADLPSSLSEIPPEMFQGCVSLRSFSLPSATESIGYYAFYECEKLDTLTIPAGLRSSGDLAFGGCDGLDAVYISDLTAWMKIEFDGRESNPLHTAGELYYTDYTPVSAVSFTDAQNRVYPYTFVGCKTLTEITIPSWIRSIGDGAFADCEYLKTAVIPDNVTSIGAGAFERCSRLMSVTLGEGVQSIGEGAFRDCERLVEVVNNSYLTFNAGEDLYGGVAAHALVVTSGTGKVVLYDDFYFIEQGESVYLLGTRFDTHPDVQSDNLFGFGISLPTDYNGKKYRVYNDAFRGVAKLTSVSITGGVEYVGDRAFKDCAELESATVIGVTDIGAYAFDGCSKLTELTLEPGLAVIRDGLLRGCGSLTEFHIPDGAVDIGCEAFLDCSALRGAVIPDGVTRIRANAFENCKSMLSVTLGASIESIEDNAFFGCVKLVEVINRSALDILPDGSNGGVGAYSLETHGTETKLVTVGDFIFGTLGGQSYLFAYIGTDSGGLTLPSSFLGESYHVYKNAAPGLAWMNELMIPDGVLSIGEGAFANCLSLSAVRIADTVEMIEAGAFEGCSSVSFFCEAESQPGGWDVNWCPGDSNVSFASGDVYTDGLYFELSEDGEYYTVTGHDRTKQIVIPEMVDGIPVRAIGEYAFASQILEAIYIPDSVEIIHYHAFYQCTKLKEIFIPSSVTEIGEGAFYGCGKLSRAILSEGLLVIGESAFEACFALCDVSIPSTVHTIGAHAFFACESIKSIVIPKSVTTVGSGAFSLGNGVPTLYCEAAEKPEGWDALWYPYGEGAYTVVWGYNGESGNNVESVGLGYTLSGDGTYYSVSDIGECTDTDIVIPSEHEGLPVREIGANAFYFNSAITSVSIPSGVVSVGENAFGYCSSLESVSLPSTLTFIGDAAFSGCDALASVDIPASVADIGAYAFESCNALTAINVAEENVNYKSVDGNLYSADGKILIQYAPGKTDTEFAVPAEVETIGARAFYHCSNLTKVIIPDTVVTVGEGVFYGNSADLTVYCGATEQPAGWSSSWNPEGVAVIWGSDGEE